MPGIQTPRSGAPKATAIGSFPGGPNHATTLCTGRNPAIPATRLRRTKAPRDPSRSARNIPCGAPSTKRSSTSHESTATRGSPASHRQMTPQGHPGPGPTPSQTPNECHFVQPATTSPPNPTAKPWTNGGPTTGPPCATTTSPRRRRRGWIQRLVSIPNATQRESR